MKKYNIKWLAEKTGKSKSRIRQLAKYIPGAKNPSGSGWYFTSPRAAIHFVMSQDKPGPKKKK